MSFTNSDGLTRDYDFIGIANYLRLFSDDKFINSIWVTTQFVVIVVIAVNVLGLFIAVMLKKASKANNIYRSIFFLPVVISQVAVAYIWKNIYAYDGLLDYILQFFGMMATRINWITDPKIALYSLCVAEIWRVLGYHMVLILAGLQTIPEELYEACDIDGGSRWDNFRHITLPLVIPGLSISMIMCTIGALKQYDMVRVLTDGGPVGATATIGYSIIDRAFNYGMMGYASSMAVVLFIIIGIITIIQNTYFNKKQVDY